MRDVKMDMSHGGSGPQAGAAKAKDVENSAGASERDIDGDEETEGKEREHDDSQSPRINGEKSS